MASRYKDHQSRNIGDVRYAEFRRFREQCRLVLQFSCHYTYCIVRCPTCTSGASRAPTVKHGVVLWLAGHARSGCTSMRSNPRPDLERAMLLCSAFAQCSVTFANADAGLTPQLAAVRRRSYLNMYAQHSRSLSRSHTKTFCSTFFHKANHGVLTHYS